MPRVPDEWEVAHVDANVRLRRHTEVDDLLLEVEIPVAGIVLSFDVSGSWAEAIFEAYREHEAQCVVLPGIAPDTGIMGRGQQDEPESEGREEDGRSKEKS